MGLLHRETQRSVRIGEPLGVMMADLDHFKQINDTYGHQTGDAVLREVARRLLASVRNYDYVGRYGGEEFLIVLAECSASDLALPRNECGLTYRENRLKLTLDPFP